MPLTSSTQGSGAVNWLRGVLQVLTRERLTGILVAAVLSAAVCALVTVYSFNEMRLSTQPLFDDSEYILTNARHYLEGLSLDAFLDTRTPVFDIASYFGFAVAGFHLSSSYIGLSLFLFALLIWVQNLFGFRAAASLFAVVPLLCTPGTYASVTGFRPDWPSSLFLALFAFWFLKTLSARRGTDTAIVLLLFYAAMLIKTSFMTVGAVTLVILALICLLDFALFTRNRTDLAKNIMLLVFAGASILLFVYFLYPRSVDYILKILITNKDVWAVANTGLFDRYTSYLGRYNVAFAPGAVFILFTLACLAMFDRANPQRKLTLYFTLFVLLIYLAISTSDMKSYPIAYTFYVPCLVLLAIVGRWAYELWKRSEGMRKAVPVVLIGAYSVFALAEFDRLAGVYPGESLRDYRIRTFDAVDRAMTGVSDPSVFVVSYSVFACSQMNAIRIFQRKPEVTCVNRVTGRTESSLLEDMARSNIVVTHTLGAVREHPHLPTTKFLPSIQARLDGNPAWRAVFVPWRDEFGMRIYVRLSDEAP